MKTSPHFKVIYSEESLEFLGKLPDKAKQKILTFGSLEHYTMAFHIAYLVFGIQIKIH